MSHVVSMRLRDDQIERLRTQARRIGRTPSETAALFVEEALRMAEFALIYFRSNAAGRDAYLRGTGLTVWEVVMVSRAHGGDITETAKHLRLQEFEVAAALNYAAAYPSEIADALKDNDKSFEELKRILPGLEEFVYVDKTDEIVRGGDVPSSQHARKDATV
jgi:uncharacterized protein (DUF433 family)